MDAVFDLVVRTSQGTLQSVRVQASDIAAARARAQRDGAQVLTCTPQAARAAERDARLGTSRRTLDIGTFAHELSSLLAAGLSVVEALHTLASKETNAHRRADLAQVADAVLEGLPLSSALERCGGRMPPLLVATVRASEQTGDLPTALLRYAEHQQGLKSLREKVVGAAIYPLLLLVVGSLVVLFLLGVVVPKFAALIETTRRELPWSSQLLMGWGRMIAAHAWSFGAVTAAGGGLLLLAVRRVVRNGARSAWIESIPVIGTTIRQFRHAQLYRTSGMLVKGGVPVARALQLSASLLGDRDRQRLVRSVELIREGRNLSGALQASGLGDAVASSMLAVAERTGTLAEILERIAAFQEARLRHSIELTSRLVEPVLMVVIGLVIGAIVVLMYLPIFDLASSLQ